MNKNKVTDESLFTSLNHSRKKQHAHRVQPWPCPHQGCTADITHAGVKFSADMLECLHKILDHARCVSDDDVKILLASVASIHTRLVCTSMAPAIWEPLGLAARATIAISCSWLAHSWTKNVTLSRESGSPKALALEKELSRKMAQRGR